MPFLASFTKALKQLPLTFAGMLRRGGEREAYLRREKIRAGLNLFGHTIRFLPFVDNIISETAEMRTAYREMLKEPSVKAAFLTKVLSVACLDVAIAPASDSPRDKEIAEFVQESLEKSKGSTRRIIEAILFGSLIDGFSVCEKVWHIETKGRWSGKVRLKHLKAKDTERLQLEGDSYRNITGVVDLWSAETFHPSNFVLTQNLPIFELPTGISDFRAAYRPYWLMDTAWKLRAVGLERFTLPMMRGTYTDPAQRPTLEDALSKARAQSWITIPEGSMVEAIELAAKGTADFESAINDLRQEIFLAIAGAFLQSLEGATPAGRGSSAVHKSTSELLQWMLSAVAADTINDQIIPDLVDLNYSGADYPTATLGAVDIAELQAEATLDTALQALGLELSKEEAYEKYHRQVPTDANDILKPPAPVPAGGGMPFAEPSPAPQTNLQQPINVSVTNPAAPAAAPAPQAPKADLSQIAMAFARTRQDQQREQRQHQAFAELGARIDRLQTAVATKPAPPPPPPAPPQPISVHVEQPRRRSEAKYSMRRDERGEVLDIVKTEKPTEAEVGTSTVKRDERGLVTEIVQVEDER